MRTEFGSRRGATSSGMVTCFSTSSGAWPGKSEITVTWVSVTSGKRFDRQLLECGDARGDEEHQQQQDEQRLVQRERDDAESLALLRFLLPQQQDAVGDDAVAGAQAGHHAHAAAAVGQRRDSRRVNALLPVCT